MWAATSVGPFLESKRTAGLKLERSACRDEKMCSVRLLPLHCPGKSTSAVENARSGGHFLKRKIRAELPGVFEARLILHEVGTMARRRRKGRGRTRLVRVMRLGITPVARKACC